MRKSKCAAELQAPCRAGVQKIDAEEGKAVQEGRGRGHSCREPCSDVEEMCKAQKTCAPRVRRCQVR